MKITIYNAKGGVGKTCIALNMALEMNYGVVTNDIFTPLEEVIDPKYFLKVGTSNEIENFPDMVSDFPDIPNDDNVIYDWKGPFEVLTRRVIMESEWLLVPTLTDQMSLCGTTNCIKQLQDFTKRIIIIINQTAIDEFDKARDQLSQSFDYPFFEIRNSKAISGIFTNKEALSSIMKNDAESAQLYKTVYLQLEAIIKHIRGW